ncbi:MAG: tRNA uridine-5-carboxymethylaminomethyl(34) synthesis GTPase MnmE [Candidatus Obscuribacterales bacterium]|nr:tRNA uridine-5-carboxymethylaminomethyl(34) synthesis GTPase MnmE [Candidatus Obscuribacterales bacterium]
MQGDDTIAAISTPPGTGAIAIVRISGPEALNILRKIFSLSPDQFKSLDWESRSHEAVHGYIWDPESAEVIDEVVVIANRGPITYTGEDIVELNCHGNPLIQKELLDLAIKLGARLSQRGEFTKRAFLSGRMDLTQAEAVLDLIQAPTTRQSRLSVSALKGHLGEKIKSTRKRLLDLLTRVVAGIDFPEEVGDLPFDDITTVVNEAKGELERLMKTARTGRFLRAGLRLSIVGRPNAGKSSLLNRILAYERAIVTDIPGTTRDSIEELFEIKGIPICLIDTAGVRITDDKVEKIGIERTGRAIAESDLVLLLFDITQGWGDEEKEILSLIGSQSYILVLNKVDSLDNPSLGKKLNQVAMDCGLSEESLIESLRSTQWHAPDTFLSSYRLDSCIDISAISALTGHGIELLQEKIESFVVKGNELQELGGSLNQRQAELCFRAASSLDEVQNSINDNMPHDCIATDLRTAIDNLSEACGDEITEELIDEVFNQFCIGK